MDVTVALLFFLVLGLALFPGWRVNDRVVSRWASSAGLELSAEGRAAAAHYLRWSKRGRTAGGLLGLAIPTLIWLVADTPGPAPLPVALILLGYVVGGLVAEVVVHRPGRTVGAALLVPRRLQDYLPRRWINLQRALAVASVLLATGYAVSPLGPNLTRPTIDGGLPGLILLVLIGPIIAGIAEGLQRLIVNRRQRVAGSEDAQLDDAIRSNSVQALAGAALATLCFLVGAELMTVANALSDPLRDLTALAVPLYAVGTVLLLATLCFWVGLAEPRRLRIRRLAGGGSPA